MIRRILLGIVGLVMVAVVALAVVISRTAECPEPLQAEAGDGQMMAVLRRCYGSTDILEYTATPIPEPAEDEVLVQVAAASVNPLDLHYMYGSPYIMRLMVGLDAPENVRFGRDFAGTVVATGSAVTRFKPGDRVFGGTDGAFAEYLTRGETGSIALLPDDVDFTQAAGIPIAGVTALQALRDHGQLKPGQRVLINGASGGVGTYAVQIAKAMGAHVTGVSSGRNLELVRSLGADEVINYKEESYIDSGQTFDLIVDMVSNHSPLENQGVLSADGRLVIVGGDKGDWIAPFIAPVMASAANMVVDQELMFFAATMEAEDLATVAGMIADGEVTTVIDGEYALSDTADALRRSESRRARGKIIIDMGDID